MHFAESPADNEYRALFPLRLSSPITVSLPAISIASVQLADLLPAVTPANEVTRLRGALYKQTSLFSRISISSVCRRKRDARMTILYVRPEPITSATVIVDTRDEMYITQARASFLATR